MEVVEEVAAVPPPPPPTNKDLSSPIAIKGKRTKRLRPHSPISFTITTPPIDNNNNNNNINNNNNNSNNDNNLHRSPSFSPASSEESTTTAEVDTARCLILLSRGHFPNYPTNDHQYISKLQNTKNRYNNDNNNSSNKTCGYTCKTCNRVFPSFQALGGHRASHKKPKNEKNIAILSDEDDFPSPSSMSSSKKRFLSNSLSLQLSNISSATFSATPKSSPSPRIHECSYCGAEFTSGQALGGHMRKHRGGPTNRTTSFPIELEIEESKIKPRNFGLSLDLNLPAPEEKNEGAPTTGHVLSTTPPPLVDCRY